MFLVLDYTLILKQVQHHAIVINGRTSSIFIEDQKTLSFISGNELKTQIHFETAHECQRAYHFALISIEAECHGAHDAKHVYNFIEGEES